MQGSFVQIASMRTQLALQWRAITGWVSQQLELPLAIISICVSGRGLSHGQQAVGGFVGKSGVALQLSWRLGL